MTHIEVRVAHKLYGHARPRVHAASMGAADRVTDSDSPGKPTATSHAVA